MPSLEPSATESSTRRPATPPGTSTTRRVFAVQEAFTELSGCYQSVLDLANATELSDSTVHRILQAGLQHEVFEQGCWGKYRPGPTTVKIALHAMAHAPSATTTQRLLAELHAATGGAALLFVIAPYGGLRRLCTDYHFGDMDPGALEVFKHPLVTVSRSLRTGASGRAILAHLPPALQEMVFTEELAPDVCPGVIRDNDVLAASLAEIRQRGYAIGRQEVVVGWDSIAAPVMWGNTVMGSVLLAKPAAEMPSDLRQLIWHTCDTARKLSEFTAAPLTSQ